MTDPLAALLQTLSWVFVTLLGIGLFLPQLKRLADAFAKRIEEGHEIPTPWGPLRGAPQAIKTGDQVGVTSEGVGGAAPDQSVKNKLLTKTYPEVIAERIYLVHQASVTVATTPDRHGLYRVRVWLEGYTGSDTAEVRRVTYRLYNDEFPQSVVATESKESMFELWLNVYGEFTVVAYVERHAAKPPLWLTRYLDLPGRPPE